ncbi:MAG: hypothetical protein FD138_476 [Planctomycetota bacterium]|nr:MAG: hypothetical protein FD138_476 [Planctomycetota bacterium]
MKSRLLVVLAAALFASQVAWACPFCSAPSLTLSEQLTQADAAVLVQWVDGKMPTEKSAGTTTYSIVEVSRGPKDLKKDEKLTVPRYRAGKKGDLFLLFGTKDKEIDWSSPLEVTETTYQYIVQAPSPESPTTKRLEYFLKFLEYSDQLVSNDAYGEFANAPYEDIVKIKDKMDREKIRKWVATSETSPTRLGLYGLLLGLCGNDKDALLMRAKIEEETQDFRLGIDGLISGYLLLTGEKGLEVIDKSKLSNKKAPFSETYAAMQALRFMWTYGNGRISKERLRQSMRELLDRPELADLVVADLARWEDWSVQERLMKLYGEGDYAIPSVKRAIVRYLLTAAKVQPPKVEVAKTDQPKEDETKKTVPADIKPKPDELPESAVQARANLDKLREKDLKTVKEAERFFFLQ